MFLILIFLLGIAIGSFLNVLIDRLPAEEKITGRSRCDHCKKKLSWYDLVPIFSYFYLGAKCRYCGKKFSFIYPVVEFVTGVMFVLVIVWANQTGQYSMPGKTERIGEALLTLHNQTLMLVALLGIVSVSVVIFFADFKYQIIPDSVQLALFAFSFLYLVTQGITPAKFLNQIVSAFLVMTPILLLFLITKGKAMGFGDVKLAFSLGFLLGTLAGLMALYIGFVAGATIGLILITLKMKKLRSKIAFGPFLIIGMLSALFYKIQLVQILRSFYSF